MLLLSVLQIVSRGPGRLASEWIHFNVGSLGTGNEKAG